MHEVPHFGTAEWCPSQWFPHESWALSKRRRQAGKGQINQQTCGWENDQGEWSEGNRVFSKESGFSLLLNEEGMMRIDLKATTVPPCLLFYPWSPGAPEHISWACIHQGQVHARKQLASTSHSRKPQAQLPWIPHDPSEAAWPVILSILCHSSACSRQWPSREGSPEHLGTLGPYLRPWLPQCLSDRAWRGEKGCCQIPELPGSQQQASHILSSTCKLNSKGSTSSPEWLSHTPNNSQAKLTQFEIKIRFIFRGIYFPLALVSVDVFSVWPDKHPSTLSLNLLSPSESHLID